MPRSLSAPRGDKDDAMSCSSTRRPRPRVRLPPTSSVVFSTSSSTTLVSSVLLLSISSILSRVPPVLAEDLLCDGRIVAGGGGVETTGVDTDLTVASLLVTISGFCLMSEVSFDSTTSILLNGFFDLKNIVGDQ
jgi:hypothetical protein